MISYRGVTKIFGYGPEAITAVKDVTLNIKPGEIVVFLGPSGCGKTTLLRLTNRLLSLTSGEIQINGQDIMSWNPVNLRQSMGYSIQEIGLFPNKTIYGNIAVVPYLLGWKERRIKDRVYELLSMLGLEPDIFKDRYPVELSGGQQQRIGVARSLAADPDILLMDEPFGAIDPINRERIQDEFLGIQSKLGKTIAFVTHDIHEAIKLGDRIAIFKDGRLIQYDTPEIILAFPSNRFISDFVGTDRALKTLGLYRVYEVMRKKPDIVIQGSMSRLEALNRFGPEDLANVIVIHGSKPMGYVDIRTFRNKGTLVRDAVIEYPVLINFNDTLRDVMSHMLMHDIRNFPVIDNNGDLTGVISHDDIRKHIARVFNDYKHGIGF
jgi:osmoprotectant transport system ATP-binding protein